MKRYYLDYYYYFLHERHYFECHEIMEEAWKAKSSYSKQDIEVGLILLATSQYHLRRDNKKGAVTCLSKSIQILQLHEELLPSIGLQKNLLNQLESLTTHAYSPITLPLTDECLKQLQIIYPHFSVRETSDSRWIHYHKTRDRSEIIALRESMRNKKPVSRSPEQGKQCDDD